MYLIWNKHIKNQTDPFGSDIEILWCQMEIYTIMKFHILIKFNNRVFFELQNDCHELAAACFFSSCHACMDANLTTVWTAVACEIFAIPCRLWYRRSCRVALPAQQMQQDTCKHRHRRLKICGVNLSRWWDFEINGTFLHQIKSKIWNQHVQEGVYWARGVSGFRVFKR